MNVRQLLREPFVQFLGLGLAVFLVISVVTDDGAAGRAIHVSEADVEHLTGIWEEKYARPPSDEELINLVSQFVHEEMLVREAMAIGLDAGDQVIRRRLVQKYEFLLDDRVEVPDPGDDVLGAWYGEHSARYQVPPRVSFKHVFFAQDRQSGIAGGDVELTLATLQRDDTHWLAEGEPFMLQREFSLLSREAVAKHFGAAFAELLFDLPEGEWSGPLGSAYGAHLVKVELQAPASLPPLAAVRAAVLSDFIDMQVQAEKAKVLDALRADYEITAFKPGLIDVDSK